MSTIVIDENSIANNHGVAMGGFPSIQIYGHGISVAYVQCEHGHWTTVVEGPGEHGAATRCYWGVNGLAQCGGQLIRETAHGGERSSVATGVYCTELRTDSSATPVGHRVATGNRQPLIQLGVPGISARFGTCTKGHATVVIVPIDQAAEKATCGHTVNGVACGELL